ncbi:Aryl-alcohol dehydrogenase [NADP(+)] [Psilocybe cubensis]|uniref:Aryl-alcohol dehydrogenase [NADP(+)] n=2 Tax=Psilocybe cubensis TaxID=181762 RepID=A0ACB8GX84_PSICU|nr:Aryl-alcohol dehydrogenase [NADP(+)] [Psilocybe cubensis]KAH9480246.1 Aryl-alcohol dehydrogenase [NADP(+)] [Psilocybe cubensis]
MPTIFEPCAPPESALARYRLLSPTAGVHVSPLQLGGMSIGDKQWEELGMGSMDKTASFALLDKFFELGGNFIDTANVYQDGSSERIIGEWAEKRGIRDRLFIATKYTQNMHLRDKAMPTQKPLFVGNNAKSLRLSVARSLENLRTGYIDLLYVHIWDWETSVEEVMGSLHKLVMQDKVLYLGVSDTPAWVVSRANQYARDHALTPFSVYQGAWNLMDRAIEREIIPMTKAEGMALAPWNVLAAGKFRTDEEEKRREESGELGRRLFGDWKRTEQERRVCAALEKVAGELGTKSITAVAIAYLMQKTPYVFPIVGGRKVEHLIQNLEALEISLSDEQINYLESVVPFDPGFPMNFIGFGMHYIREFTATANFDKVPPVQPIRPSPKNAST